MPDAATILRALVAKTDQTIAQLETIKAGLVLLLPPGGNGADAEGADDFAEHHLIDPVSGASRIRHSIGHLEKMGSRDRRY